MAAGQILAIIPWNKIIKYGPTIAEAAGKIYDSVKKRWFVPKGAVPKKSSKESPVSLKELEERVSELEKNEVEQAELVQKIAIQLNDISLGMKVMSNRIMIALVVSSIAILMVLIYFVYYLIK